MPRRRPCPTARPVERAGMALRWIGIANQRGDVGAAQLSRGPSHHAAPGVLSGIGGEAPARQFKPSAIGRKMARGRPPPNHRCHEKIVDPSGVAVDRPGDRAEVVMGCEQRRDFAGCRCRELEPWGRDRTATFCLERQTCYLLHHHGMSSRHRSTAPRPAMMHAPSRMTRNGPQSSAFTPLPRSPRAAARRCVPCRRAGWPR